MNIPTLNTPAFVRRVPRSVSALLIAGALTLVPALIIGAVPAEEAVATTSQDVTVMPTSAPVGWNRLYTEGFSTPADTGSFVNESPDDWNLKNAHPYARSLRSYPDGWATTWDLSLNYASKTAGVSSETWGTPGVFELNGHTASISGKQRSLGGSFFPVIRPDASSTQEQTAQTYGRYSVRFRTTGGESTGSATGAGYGTAFLLWPANDNWSEGEIDYPEMAWGGKISGYVHEINNPSNNAHVIDTTTPTDDDWHTATIEWYPNALAFYLDAVMIKKVTDNVPTTPFRWGFQSGAHTEAPAPEVQGKLMVDWITVDAYDGATPPK